MKYNPTSQKKRKEKKKKRSMYTDIRQYLKSSAVEKSKV